MRQAQRELSKESLQLGVLRFGFLQDGDVGVGILPQREEIIVGGASLRAIARQGVGACDAKMRERPILFALNS
jgi:hypothetical protein